MPRVNTKTKNKAGKPYNCARCSEPIKPGEKYHEWSFRYGGTHRQHEKHGHPRASQLTQSKMSGAYAAIEDAQDGIEAARKAGDASGVPELLRSCATEIESVRDEYQESFDNMGDNFQNGSPGEEINEKIDALTEFADSCNSKADEAEGDLESDDEADTEGATGEDKVDTICSDAESTLEELSI